MNRTITTAPTSQMIRFMTAFLWLDWLGRVGTDALLHGAWACLQERLL
jgi:hypothetical protein